MSETTELAVTANRPASPIHVQGTDHITVTGSNVEDTIEFYRDLLGMPLVLEQPNLDRPEYTHLFFDTGDGRLLTFFVTDDEPSRDTLPIEVGHVHHLAFRINTERLSSVKSALDSAGYEYSEFDRGAFHAVYTRDNNGLTIELITDKYPVPDDRRGEILALAHQYRVEDGAEFVNEDHMDAALAELGVDIDPKSVPDAPAGAGIDQ